MEKRPFYWCHRWVEDGIPFSLRGLIDARSEAEILELFPELEISEEVPASIDFEQLSKRFHYDIDLAPSGALLEVVRLRDRN
jgi:hypothetical protein